MTEITTAKAPRTVPLHLARVGKNQFTATVRFTPAPGGFVTSDITGCRKTAQASLEAKLLDMGYTDELPKWDIRDMGDIAPPKPVDASAFGDEEPVTNVVGPLPPRPSPPVLALPLPAAPPAVKPELPAPPAAKPERTPVEAVRDNLLASIASKAIEEAKADVFAPVTPDMPAGRINPLTGLTFWVDVYLAAMGKLMAVEYPGETPREIVQNLRIAVDLVMNNAGCVGAWDRAPSGDYWIRYASSRDSRVFDPTMKNTNPGEGLRREKHHRNINGNWDDVSKAGQKRAGKASDRKAAAQVAAKEKAATQAKASASPKYVPQNEEDKVAYRKAYAFGSALGAAFREAGQDQRLGYKVGQCAALRAQGATPHAKFEADLAAAGVTLEYIASYEEAALEFVTRPAVKAA